MSANAAEWVMAAASVATGLFVGVQSYLLNDTLNSPFEANLQAREIDVCTRAITSKEAFVSSLTYQGLLSRFSGFSSDFKIPIQTSEDKLDLEVEDKFSDLWGVVAKNSFETFQNDQSDFRQALAEMKIYAEHDTVAEIERLELTLIGFGPKGILTTQKESSEVARSHSEWRAEVETDFSSLHDKCRKIMLGESRGLI